MDHIESGWSDVGSNKNLTIYRMPSKVFGDKTRGAKRRSIIGQVRKTTIRKSQFGKSFDQTFALPVCGV